MALLLKHSVFFHVPKTGGRWIRKVCRDSGIAVGEVGREGTIHRLGSPEAYRYRHWERARVFPGFCEDAFTFAFVRHPLTWYQSRWRYRMRTGWRRDNFIDAPCGSGNFEEFVRRCLRQFPDGLLTRICKRFVGESADELDFVGQQEHLVEDLLTALRVAGEDVDEERIRGQPRMNVSSRYYGDACAYTPELKADVLKAKAWVLRTFGYGDEPEEDRGDHPNSFTRHCAECTII